MNELEKFNIWLVTQCLGNYEVVKTNNKFALIDHKHDFTTPIAFFNSTDEVKNYLESDDL